ncbi:MAG: DUF167 domain-containing protein [Anaerolineae bacterium]|nr:DUF167 domain-containing protein [Anaerolineae bacterium]
MPKDLQFKITDAKGGAAFTVRVVTRARRQEIVGIQEDGTLKIRLTGSPADSNTNEELIEFLAGTLGVDKEQIEIVAGEKGREKLISVEGITPDAVNQKLVPSEPAESEA